LFWLFMLAFLMRVCCQRYVFPSLLHSVSLFLQRLTFISHMGAIGSMYHESLLGHQHVRIILPWATWPCAFCCLAFPSAFLRFVFGSFWLILL
jgi:hypothetical protein